MRRNLNTKLLLIVLTFTLLSCATAQLTPDQQSRVALDRAQTQLNVWWDAAYTFYKAQPQKADEWKTIVVPAFDTCNKTLAALIVQYKTGAVTPDQLQNVVQTAMNNVLVIHVQKGVIK